MNSETFRTALAVACVLGGVYIHYSGTVVMSLGAFIWLLLAAGAGFMRPSGRLLLIAPLPWLIGVAGGVLVGQHDSLGELWFVPLLLSTVAGLIGVTFGVSAGKGKSRSQQEQAD